MSLHIKQLNYVVNRIQKEIFLFNNSCTHQKNNRRFNLNVL